MGGGNSKQKLQVEMTLVDAESKIDLLLDHTPNPISVSPFNNYTMRTTSPPMTGIASVNNSLSSDLRPFLPKQTNSKSPTKTSSKTKISTKTPSKTTPKSNNPSEISLPNINQQRQSFDASVLHKHSPIGESSTIITNTRAKSKSNSRVVDVPSPSVSNRANTMEDRSTLLTGYKTHSSQSITTNTSVKDGELLNYHGDASIEGKPHLVSLLISNMDDMIFIVTDLKNNYFIYETSYPRFLQKFFSGEESAASLPPYKRHRRMLDMIGLAFSSQTYNILPESTDNNISNIKISLTLRYQADDIDKTVVFKLIKQVPDLTDSASNLIHTTICKLITGLYGNYHNTRNAKTNILRQTLPSMALITEYGTVGTIEEEEPSLNSEQSEDDLVKLNESKNEEKKIEDTPKLSFSMEQSGEQQEQQDDSKIIKVKKSSVKPRKFVTVTIDEEPELITTTEMLLFLKKLQAIISVREDIPVDKSTLSLIIKTIAKNSDIVEDEFKDTNPDLEVSAFLNAFVKPRAKSRERAGWRTIANLIRVGVVFKQQTLQTTFKNINAMDSNPGLEEKLKSIDRYDFDVFELNEVSRGKPLYVIFTYYLRRFGLMDHFNIDREVLHAFLREVETNYGYNAFHNSIHAADVLQTFMYILDLIGMIPFLTHEELLAVILAAAMHDFQHPGTTNQFQILSESDLAIIYSDKSVLESHHVASFYRVLQQEKYNILKTLTVKQRRQIREICIGLISATDLSFQGSFMNQLQAVYDVSHGHIDLMSEKSLVLKLCLKVADTANTSKPLYLHFSWISRLQREFFIQGDKEKEIGMDISPFMDRNKCNFTKCQNSFIEYVTYPFVALFAKCFKEAVPILEYSKLVKDHWSNSVLVSTFEEVEQMIRNELAKVNKVVTQSHLGANTSFNTTPRDQPTDE